MTRCNNISNGTLPAQGSVELSSQPASRHVPSASLGQYASLSFVVIGRGQEIESREKMKVIFLWERLLAAILRFQRFERLERPMTNNPLPKFRHFRSF